MGFKKESRRTIESPRVDVCTCTVRQSLAQAKPLVYLDIFADTCALHRAC